MKALIIPIHSFVDIITNSSTVIYVSTYQKTEKMIKEFVNALLKSFGSDKKFDDFFEYKEVNRYPHMDYAVGQIKDDLREKNPDTEDEELEKVAEAMFYKKLESDDHDDEYGYDSIREIILTPKNSSAEAIKLCETIERIFSLEEHDQ